MRLEKIDLNLLVALDALLTHQSVTKAANAVHLSQPAMSNSLAKLRQHFDDRLFTMNGRKMEFTPLALSLRDPIGNVLQLSRGILRSSASFNPKTSLRQFAITASDLITVVLIPHLTRHLAREAPNVSLSLLEIDPRDPVGDLMSGVADFAIMPREFASRDHPSLPIYEDIYSCVVWSHNEFVRDTLTVDDYLRLKHVVINFGRPDSEDTIRKIIDELGIDAKIAAHAPAFSILPELIVGTNHLATLPLRLALSRLPMLDIRVLPAPIELPRISEVLQWRSSRNDDPGIVWMRDAIAVAASQFFCAPAPPALACMGPQRS